MAFTSAQLAQIRTYLGYPAVYLYQDPALEGVMKVVGDDVDASALVSGYLVNIKAVLDDIQTTALPLAGFRVGDRGDAELGENNEQTRGKKDIGRMWVGLLSGVFGVEPNGDIFSGKGYGGHGWCRDQRSTLAGLG